LARVILDQRDGIEFDPVSFPVANLHALWFLPQGLHLIAQSVRDRELAVAEEAKGHLTFWKPGGDLAGILANWFGWFSISLVSYLRLVRLVSLVQEHNWTTRELQQRENKEVIKSTCSAYLKDVIPAVHQWRNKVAAHPAFTDPFKDDSVGTLELSVMASVTFAAPHFMVGALQWSSDGEPSSFKEWGVTPVFESLAPRFWPNLALRPITYSGTAPNEGGAADS
jgi:hypothetical protein